MCSVFYFVFFKFLNFQNLVDFPFKQVICLLVMLKMFFAFSHVKLLFANKQIKDILWKDQLDKLANEYSHRYVWQTWILLLDITCEYFPTHGGIRGNQFIRFSKGSRFRGDWLGKGGNFLKGWVESFRFVNVLTGASTRGNYDLCV